MQPFRVLDLFCGTGGFSKGFEDQGSFDVILGIDSLDVAVKSFRSNHHNAIALTRDIRNSPPQDVSGQLDITTDMVDVIIGGPPCQGFSSIRPHRSVEWNDPRNGLFRDFAEYVAWFRPRVFVLENVVGLVTFNGGEAVEIMQSTFESLGYTTDWRIMNAAHYGVPQKRERLILLGVERGLPLSFPRPTHYCEVDTIGIRDKGRMLLPEKANLFNLGNPPLLPAVTVADAIDDLPPLNSGEAAARYTAAPRTTYQADRRAGSRSLTLHASTAHTPRMLEIIRHSGPNISHVPERLITSGFSSSYSRIAGDEPSVTITVNFVHPASNRCIHPTQDRALTPREGARIQSFDDDFHFAGNRTQIVKQIGNAVPPLLGRVIAKHVAALLNSTPAAAQDTTVA